MNSDRKHTVLAGLLIILGTVAGIFSSVLIIEDTDYLTKIPSHANELLRGAFFQLIMAPIYAGIGLILYPLLKKYNESLALGFAGFKIITGVFHIIGVIFLLLLLQVSREFARVEPADNSYFHVIGELLRKGRDLLNHIAVILSACFGAIMFYYILFVNKLVPRWLSSWGIFGVILAMFATVLFILGAIDIVTPVYLGLLMPMALQEIVLAVWFILKGLNNAKTTNL